MPITVRAHPRKGTRGVRRHVRWAIDARAPHDPSYTEIFETKANPRYLLPPISISEIVGSRFKAGEDIVVRRNGRVWFELIQEA